VIGYVASERFSVKTYRIPSSVHIGSREDVNQHSNMNGHGSILNGHAHAGTDIAALRKALTTALSDLDAAAIRKNIETMVGLASESKDVQYGSAIADAVVNAVCGPAASHGMPAAIHVNGTAGSASLKER